MNIFRLIKNSLIIFLSLFMVFIVAMFFFADFGPNETIYTRSFLATVVASLTALMLGYVFRKWWFAFFSCIVSHFCVNYRDTFGTTSST